jgi:hypothetical protein
MPFSVPIIVLLEPLEASKMLSSTYYFVLLDRDPYNVVALSWDPSYLNDYTFDLFGMLDS